MAGKPAYLSQNWRSGTPQPATTPTPGLNPSGKLAGRICWVPPKDQLPPSVRIHNLQEDGYNHPAVILSQRASAQNTVEVLMITSFQGRPFDEACPYGSFWRGFHFPIKPADRHPDNTWQLRLASHCPDLEKKSYVNIKEKFTVPLSVLRPYLGKSSGRSPLSAWQDAKGRPRYVLSEKSYTLLVDLRLSLQTLKPPQVVEDTRTRVCDIGQAEGIAKQALAKPALTEPALAEPALAERALAEPVLVQQALAKLRAAEQAFAELLVDAAIRALAEPLAEQTFDEQPIAEPALSEEPIAELGAAEQPLAEQGHAEQGRAEQGRAKQDLAEEGLAGQELAEQDLAEQDLAVQDLTEQGVAEQVVTNEVVTDEVIADEGIADEGIADEGIADEGVTERPSSPPPPYEQAVPPISSPALDAMLRVLAERDRARARDRVKSRPRWGVMSNNINTALDDPWGYCHHGPNMHNQEARHTPLHGSFSAYGTMANPTPGLRFGMRDGGHGAPPNTQPESWLTVILGAVAGTFLGTVKFIGSRFLAVVSSNVFWSAVIKTFLLLSGVGLLYVVYRVVTGIRVRIAQARQAVSDFLDGIRRPVTDAYDDEWGWVYVLKDLWELLVLFWEDVRGQSFIAD